MQTWMYIAFPVLLYAGERVFRAIRSGSYEVDIMKVFDQTFFMFKICIKASGLTFLFHMIKYFPFSFIVLVMY